MHKNFFQFLFLALIILFPCTGSCEKYYGYIVNLNHDTIKCKVIFGPSQFDGPTKAVLFDQAYVKIEIDEETIKYSANDINCFALYVFKSWHVYFGVKVSPAESRFMKKVTDGTLTLYSRKTYNMFSSRWETHFCLRNNKTNKTLYLQVGIINNKEKLLIFFDDCPGLKTRLEDKIYRVNNYTHWESMVVYYNDNC